MYVFIFNVFRCCTDIIMTMDPLSTRDESKWVWGGWKCSSTGVKQPLAYGIRQNQTFPSAAPPGLVLGVSEVAYFLKLRTNTQVVSWIDELFAEAFYKECYFDQMICCSSELTSQSAFCMVAMAPWQIKCPVDKEILTTNWCSVCSSMNCNQFSVWWPSHNLLESFI